MIPLITKQQIGKFVTLTENIPDWQLTELIGDVQVYDTEDVLPTALLAAIETQVKAKIQQWNKNDTYAIGDKVWFDGESAKYYKAIAINTNSQPPNDNWAAFELMDFYEFYLVPFMAVSFQYRFIASWGVQTTQSGLVQATDPNGTYQPISDAARGVKMGDAKNKISIRTGKLSKKLNDVNFTFDGVRYPQDNDKSTQIKRKVRIYALGADNNRGCSNRNRIIE